MSEIEKKINWAFKNYQSMKKKAVDILNDTIYAGTTAAFTERVKTSEGNAIQDRVLAAENRVEHLWRWCLVVEKTFDHYRPDGRSEYIRDRFIHGIPKKEIIKKYGAYKTLYNWDRCIYATAVYWAEVYKVL